MKRFSTQFLGLSGLLLSLFLVASSSLQVFKQQETSGPLQDENINLALRAAGHRILRQAGDSVSTIPSVEHNDTEHRWLLRLNHSIVYDSLPGVLQRAFLQYDITLPYNVSLLDCETSELMLGYTSRTQQTGEEVPCGGRSQTAQCYALAVTFLPPASMTFSQKIMITAGLLSLLGFGILFWRKRLQNTRLSLSPQPAEAVSQLSASPLFTLGSTVFDPVNQTLQVQGKVQQLTYRESKLLQFFARHPNQLLERERILKAVWEDEGILVGRSLDVFVSRLRKLFQQEPGIRFMTVHGVGYKMQV